MYAKPDKPITDIPAVVDANGQVVADGFTLLKDLTLSVGPIWTLCKSPKLRLSRSQPPITSRKVFWRPKFCRAPILKRSKRQPKAIHSLRVPSIQ